MSIQNLPILNESNFSNWKFRVECILDEKGCKEVALLPKNEEELANLDKKDKELYKTKDSKAKSIVVQCISDKHIEYIKDCKTSYDMFKSLSNIFERKSTLSKLYTRRQLLSLKCDNETKLQEHFIKFDGLIRDLESTGCRLDEDDKVCHLLLTMSKKYDTVITVLETTSSTLTLDFVKSKLLDVELKLSSNLSLKQPASNANDCTFQVGLNSNNKQRCFKCGSTQHYQKDCPKNSFQFKENRDYFQNRGKPGNNYHNRGKYNLPKTRGRQHYSNRNWTNKNDNANIADNNENSLSFAVLPKSMYTSLSSDKDMITFVLDSGATNNLVQSKMETLMTDVNEIVPINFKVANGETMVARKSGKLKVYYTPRYGENHRQLIIEALIVDCLPYNLLSVQKVNKAGCKVIFENGKAVITKKNDLILTCNMINNLFIAKFECQTSMNVYEKQNNSDGISEENLWHLRFGHLNRRGLQLLGLPYSSNPCDSCQKGKATRLSFKSINKPRSSCIGELLHCDIWGPVNEPTPDGERYYLSVMDDYSHFTCIYLLTKKSEAEKYLIEHILKLKTKNILVSRLRTDNGGEFNSNNLKDFCSKNGIKQEYTAPYTPQQNGVAERLNRTLLDKVRSMFVDTNLPKYLWGEAIRCAVFQLNRSPTQALNGEQPANIYYGKSDFERLRIFGSKAWVYRLPKQGKLEQRAVEMRLVGYAGAGYRLWNPETNQIVISRDVRFNERDFKYTDKMKNVVSEIKENLDEEELNDDEENLEEEKSNDDKSCDHSETNRPSRNMKKPSYLEDYELYSAFCLLTENQVPQTYEDAIKNEEWRDAIQSELKSHSKFGTWEPTTELPIGQKTIDTKWVFRIKENGIKKARLVVKGYQQECDMNVYAPVARFSTVRTVISLAVAKNWKISQLDVPTAFLNGELKSDVYIKIPQGCTKTNKTAKTDGTVYKLNKALYGLKEAPRCWNERLNSFAESNNLKRSYHDFCLYTGKNVIMLIYVDDILILGENTKQLIDNLKKEFNSKDLGEIKQFLGIEIEREENRTKIKQEKLIEKILKKFNMTDCKGTKTPMEVNFKVNQNENIINVPYRELIGSLMYVALTSRPDIMFSVSFLSQFLNKPTQQLWKAGKRIVRYLKETKHLSLTYSDDKKEDSILAYSDADWASNLKDRKSVSGCVIYCFGNAVAWFSRKQSSVSLSTTEAEYIAAAAAAAELLSISGVVKDLNANVTKEHKPVLLVDNQGAIDLTRSFENSKRSKHIDIRYHFLKDLVMKDTIKIEYISTNDNISDILTKPLGNNKFDSFRQLLRIN